MPVLKKLFKATGKYIIRKRKRVCTAVIVAAGNASRMRGTDKIMAPLNGEPVICHTVRAFQECSFVQHIVIVTRDDLLDAISKICVQQGFTKVSKVISGGSDRTESVLNGLSCVPEKTTLVAVHDGARPLVTQKVIDAAVSKAIQTGAAAPAVPVKDTVKIASGSIVLDTPDRSSLFAVQTPQVFDYDLLRGALNYARDNDISVTDDCSAVEHIGMRIHLVEGGEDNIKITTPLDLDIAAMILSKRSLQI